MPGRLSDSASVCTFLEVARVHPVSVETESEHLDALSAQVCVGERVCVCVYYKMHLTRSRMKITVDLVC